MAWIRSNGGSTHNERHGAVITITATEDFIGVPCNLYFNNNIVDTKTFSSTLTLNFVVQDIGTFTPQCNFENNLVINKPFQISAEDIVNKNAYTASFAKYMLPSPQSVEASATKQYASSEKVLFTADQLRDAYNAGYTHIKLDAYVEGLVYSDGSAAIGQISYTHVASKTSIVPPLEKIYGIIYSGSSSITIEISVGKALTGYVSCTATGDSDTASIGRLTATIVR